MIEARHQIPLETAVKHSNPGRKALVEHLYQVAMGELKSQPIKEPETFWIHIEHKESPIKTAKALIVTVTDMDTGLFIRLTGLVEKARPSNVVDGPYLTFGKTYLSETKNPQLQNTAAKIWR